MKTRVLIRPMARKPWFALATVTVLAVVVSLVAFSSPSPAEGVAIATPYDPSGLVWGDSGASGAVLFNTGNSKAVSSGPTVPATFATSSTCTITSISDYHYGSSAAPGTISLVDGNGHTVGSWPASGLSNNYYWYVRPNVTIGPGTYTVVDSSPSTWSYTAGGLSSGMGFTRVLASASASTTTTTSSTTTTTTQAAKAFPDVPATHPYFAAITDLASRGIIGGFDNGNFGPGDAVTRQQFAKMIVLTGGYPVSESDVCYFTDVQKSDATSLYPDNYVAVAAAHQITKGTSASAFSPSNHISRYQMISMVVRAADDLHPGLLATPPAGYAGTTPWGDDPTHGANARRAEYNGLLAGLDLSALSPYGDMTRGEVAQVLHNLLVKLASGPTTTTTLPPTTTTTVPSATLLFSDDFSKTNSDWFVGELSSEPGSYLGYENGAYFLQVPADYWYMECGPLFSWDLRDGRIEVDVTLAKADPDWGGCGLVFRCQDADNFYAFELGGDGSYALYRVAAGDWTKLVDWTDSDAVKHLGQANHVEVVLSGDSISVRVNGTLLLTKADSADPSGSIGLLLDCVGSPSSGKAVFDNLKVWSK